MNENASDRLARIHMCLASSVPSYGRSIYIGKTVLTNYIVMLRGSRKTRKVAL